MLKRYRAESRASTTPLTGAGLQAVTASRNAWIEIDLAALDTNLAAIRGHLAPSTAIIAVVKANAYGHGAAPIALALEAAGVDQFAVAWLEEAIALREAGVRAPIVVLEHGFPEGAETAVEYDITCTIHSREMASAFSAAAVAAETVARVQLKVDTGLHRFGLDAREAIELADWCRDLPALTVDAIWTHMANADEADDAFSAEQLHRFDEVRKALPWIPHAHAANSATALRRPEAHFDGVRTGLSLYGLLPDNTPDPGITPLMSLKARLARVHRLAPGEGVSYGHTWRAPRESIVGLVPVGYADGWRRSLGNRGHVLVMGQRCPIVGRVCMDQLLVDLTELPNLPAEGDEVVLMGEQQGARVTAAEVAALTDTITWEVVAALLPRIPRVYHRDGCVTSVA